MISLLHLTSLLSHNRGPFVAYDAPFLFFDYGTLKSLNANSRHRLQEWQILQDFHCGQVSSPLLSPDQQFVLALVASLWPKVWSPQPPHELSEWNPLR